MPLLTKSAASTLPAAELLQVIGSPSAVSASYSTEKVSPFCNWRWKSRSVANTSAICVAMPSGMRASSVAANSDVRTVPLPMRTCAASGAVSSMASSLPAMRLTVRRVKCVPSNSALAGA